MLLTPQTDLFRPSSTADSWGRYYTANWVSECLVNSIQATRPKVIVELGAGRGSLATAAAAKWQRARFVTVDADAAAHTNLNRAGKQTLAHTHHIHDVLDEELADRIGLSPGSVDIAVCNPPYVRPRWRDSFGRILEDAGLSGALQSVHDAGADLLFIAQNLRLLKQHGKLGLILPDGLITGEKFQGVRSVLLREHLVEQVIQLPRRVFPGTEAQTYLVVLAKRSGQTESVALQEMRADGVLSMAIQVPADVARQRLDYRFHNSTQAKFRNVNARQKRQTIGEATLSIFRGTVSSNQIKLLEWPVFHLGDFASRSSTRNLVVPKKFSLSDRMLRKVPTSIRIARPGDILVARIGRNLQDKVSIVRDRSCIISDCVFSLRVADTYLETVLAFLTSEPGKQALSASSHGVGARYLSRADLLGLVLKR
jgi:type I restriction enzyme M protein